MKLVNQSVAHTWQCDTLGHMTTRFYLHMFDDASYHLFYQVFGWQGAQDDDGRLAWVDVRHVIEYRAEVLAGDVLDIHGEVSRVGGKSLQCHYEMTNRRTNGIAATLDATSVMFDLEQRRSAPMTDVIRSAAEAALSSPGD